MVPPAPGGNPAENPQMFSEGRKAPGSNLTCRLFSFNEVLCKELFGGRAKSHIFPSVHERNWHNSLQEFRTQSNKLVTRIGTLDFE